MAFTCLLLLVAPLAVGAANPPTVEVVRDLVETFGSAKVADCLEAAVRRPGTAGGVRENALFEHPLVTAKPARVAYDLALPQLAEGDLLVLVFDIGLADGIQGGKGEDGVRFMVEVDGRRLFAQEWKAMHWRPGGVDLTAFGGRTVQLTLLTDAMANTSYDWALWGNPRILHFKGGTPGEDLESDATVGVLAVKPVAGGGGKVRLTPAGEGPPLEWTLPATASATNEPWLALDFSFARARGVRLDWEPKDLLNPDRMRIGAYPPQPRLVRISPGRAAAIAGAALPIHAEVKNEGRGRLSAGQAHVELTAGKARLTTQVVPELQPGETWTAAWLWLTPERPAAWTLLARLVGGPGFESSVASNCIRTVRASKDRIPLNETWDLEVCNAGFEDAFATIVRNSGHRLTLGVLRPLAGVTLAEPSGPIDWPVPLRLAGSPSKRGADGGPTLIARGARDPQGNRWDVRLTFEPVPGRPLVRLKYHWQADRDVSVRRFLGPNLYVGDNATGEAKTWGLFPGLEYLYGPERSSNPRDFAAPLDDRRTPQPWKITIPLMAVTVGSDSESPPERPGRFFAPDSLQAGKESQTLVPPFALGPRPSAVTAALFWNPLQKWDGEHAFPSARFASPNFDEGMENHRLALFLPSVPDFVPENAGLASKPFQLRAGQTVTLDCTLVLADEPVLSAVREWLRDFGGLPKPHPWPRSFQQELDVCRAGFLKTVWDEGSQKWRHCIGWAPAQAPGFAALLWMGGHVAESPEGRTQSRERVELAAQNMLRESGPAGFTSQAGCHIMQWEFPFLYGYLPEAVAGLEEQIHALIASQRADGGWVYEPANAEQADLGQAGDSVLGTCANWAATLLRYARITGDTNVLAAGEKALVFMERFRIPRGGQTWECPMYEPDILAAAYAIKACLDGYRATANPRWLHDAVYWAETGVPFIYLWSLPDKPMMLGATIPVFGSTFYTHSWLGVPVQWCGLVYSYHVLHLAEELEKTSLRRTDSPLPLALGFTSADWRRVTELITASGMCQQFGEGDQVGAYPDSISNFEKRNPAFLNPEDILVNLLALQGHDPDVKTARLKAGQGSVVISSGAVVQNAHPIAGGASFDLRAFAGERSHTLIVGLKPREVRVNGELLPESPTPVRREPGWWWDESHNRLFLVAPHPSDAPVTVNVSGTMPFAAGQTGGGLEPMDLRRR